MAMRDDGEQPAAKTETALSEQSPIKLSLVISMLGLAALGGSAHFRIGANEKAIESLITDGKSTAREMADVKTNAAVGASGLQSLKDEMAKANEKLDRLLEEKTNSADYRPRRRGQ